jgi:hypothetical protein
MKFLKSQWPYLLFGACALALAIINLVQGDDLVAVSWTLSFVTWIFIAKIGYNDERIAALEKEVEQLKNRAITDIEETEPNCYTCMRRLGPDKEVK